MATATKPTIVPTAKPKIITPEITPLHEIGTNTLLTGFVGHGKSTSIATFIKAGLIHDIELKVVAVTTETGGIESLLDGMRIHAMPGEKSLPMDRLFYRHIPPVSEGWSAIKEMAKQINRMSYKDLTEVKGGLGKRSQTQFLDLVSLLSNFKDQYGTVLGPIDKLDNTWLFVLDSVSGLNRMSRRLTVGLKPAPHKGEWGTMMSAEEELVMQILSDTKCFTCLTSHIDREVDDVIGKPQFVPCFLGSKLGPVIPKEFSDVILQVRDGDKFRWNTIEKDHSCLKARNLPLSDKLPPSFELIVSTWLKRKAMVESGQMSPAEYKSLQEDDVKST